MLRNMTWRLMLCNLVSRVCACKKGGAYHPLRNQYMGRTVVALGIATLQLLHAVKQLPVLCLNEC